MDQIYFEIGSMEGLIQFIQDAKGVGLLKDISCEKVKNLLSEKEFPIHIPVEMDKLFDLMANPVVKKMFGKKIEDTAVRTILKAANE